MVSSNTPVDNVITIEHVYATRNLQEVLIRERVRRRLAHARNHSLQQEKERKERNTAILKSHGLLKKKE